MTQQKLVQLAQQGNANAIATLMNRHLQTKGITAKAVLKNECLQIMLEAAQAPNQKILVPFLQKGIASLGCEIIREVKVYGRQSGESLPDWNEEFRVQQTDISLPELAKQKDIKAITVLINQWVKPYSINAKASLKGDCLQVMLEALDSPDQSTASLVSEKLKDLNIQGLTLLKVYGKQIDEDFPDWTQDLSFTVTASESVQNDQDSSSEQASRTHADHSSKSLDTINLSNELYDTLNIIFAQALTCRLEEKEDSRSIYEIVHDFVFGIEEDLILAVENIDAPLSDLFSKKHIELDGSKLKGAINIALSSKVSTIRMAVRQLERVSQEVLEFDFPQESDAIKTFFKDAASEFSANLVGRTTMSQEMIVGATIGSLIAPGLGTFIGGAVGGWFSGNKKQKQMESLLSRYEKARQEIFNEWRLLLQFVYEQIYTLLLNLHDIKLMPYALFQQASERYNQANSFFHNQEFERAIEAYDNALQSNPLFVSAWNNKGYALQNLERYEEAIIAYDQAISIDPSFVLPLFNKGLVLRALERHREAIEMYRRVVAISPDDFEAWIYMISSLHDLGQLDEMLEACNEAVKVNPDHYLGWYSKACGLMLKGKVSDSLDALETAIAINPESTQELAKTDPAFDSFRNSERFILLMESAVGVDYGQLKRFLAQKKWKEADQETARLMRLAIKNLMGWDQAPLGLDKDTIANFPASDLATIDKLWVENSEGKYGFSVQKAIYQRFGGTEEFNGAIRDKFGDYTGWRVKDSDGYSSWRNADKFEYNFDSNPRGHLPSSLWTGDGLFENPRDRLIALFSRLS